MAKSTPPSGGSQRPRPSTPAERGEEFAKHQRQLKAEADERRKNATPRPASPARRAQGRKG